MPAQSELQLLIETQSKLIALLEADIKKRDAQIVSLEARLTEVETLALVTSRRVNILHNKSSLEERDKMRAYFHGHNPSR